MAKKLSSHALLPQAAGMLEPASVFASTLSGGTEAATKAFVAADSPCPSFSSTAFALAVSTFAITVR